MDGFYVSSYRRLLPLEAIINFYLSSHRRLLPLELSSTSASPASADFYLSSYCRPLPLVCYNHVDVNVSLLATAPWKSPTSFHIVYNARVASRCGTERSLRCFGVRPKSISGRMLFLGIPMRYKRRNRTKQNAVTHSTPASGTHRICP